MRFQYLITKRIQNLCCLSSRTERQGNLQEVTFSAVIVLQSLYCSQSRFVQREYLFYLEQINCHCLKHNLEQGLFLKRWKSIYNTETRCHCRISSNLSQERAEPLWHISVSQQCIRSGVKLSPCCGLKVLPTMSRITLNKRSIRGL